MQCGSLLSNITNERQGSWNTYHPPPISLCLRAEQVPVAPGRSYRCLQLEAIKKALTGQCVPRRYGQSTPTLPAQSILTEEGREWWQKGREEQTQRPSVMSSVIRQCHFLSFLPPFLSFPDCSGAVMMRNPAGRVSLLPQLSPNHNPATIKASAPYVHPEIPSSLNCFPLCGVLFVCLL